MLELPAARRRVYEFNCSHCATPGVCGFTMLQFCFPVMSTQLSLQRQHVRPAATTSTSSWPWTGLVLFISATACSFLSTLFHSTINQKKIILDLADFGTR